MKKESFISNVNVASARCCANSYATSSTNMIQLLILEILALMKPKYSLPVLFILISEKCHFI